MCTSTSTRALRSTHHWKLGRRHAKVPHDLEAGLHRHLDVQEHEVRTATTFDEVKRLHACAKGQGKGYSENVEHWAFKHDAQNDTDVHVHTEMRTVRTLIPFVSSVIFSRGTPILRSMWRPRRPAVHIQRVHCLSACTVPKERLKGRRASGVHTEKRAQQDIVSTALATNYRTNNLQARRPQTQH